VAKGLACATGARLVGVPTLAALARAVAPHHQGMICPLLDARRGELYTACFMSAAGAIERASADVVVTLEALLERLPRPCTVVGDAVPRYGAWLAARLGVQVTLLPFEAHGPRGGVVAAIGWERLRAGPADEVSDLEPLYIRASDAERNRADF